MKKSSYSTKSIVPLLEKIEQLSKGQRIGICVATFLVLIGIFGWFMYWPKIEKVKNLNAEYERLETELTLARAKAKDLEKYRAEMKQAEAQFDLVMKKLPEKKEIPSLLAGISQSGQDSGLEFMLFQPKPEIPKDFYVEIPVSIEVTGGYHNVALFFDKVARLSRIVNLKDIKMTTLRDSDKLSTACTAITYKFQEAPPANGQDTNKKKR